MKYPLSELYDKIEKVSLEILVKKYLENRKNSNKILNLLNETEIELNKELNLSNKNQPFFNGIMEIMENTFEKESYGKRLILNHQKNEIIYETYSVDGHKGEEFDNKLYHLKTEENRYVLDYLKAIFYNENIYLIGIKEEKKIEQERQKKLENIFEQELGM